MKSPRSTGIAKAGFKKRFLQPSRGGLRPTTRPKTHLTTRPTHTAAGSLSCGAGGGGVSSGSSRSSLLSPISRIGAAMATDE